MKIEDKHKIFLRIANEFSKMSHCVSYQVCALFVRENRIISTGINGTPTGHKNCDDIFGGYDLHIPDVREAHKKFSDANEIHAEVNAILNAALNGISLKNCILYCTLRPCEQCLKNLIALGVKEIYYSQSYDRKTNKYYYDIKKQSKIKLTRIKI